MHKKIKKCNATNFSSTIKEEYCTLVQILGTLLGTVLTEIQVCISTDLIVERNLAGFTTCATWDCFGPGSRPYADTLELRLERVGPS